MISQIENYTLQKKLTFFVCILFLIKLLAWYWTHSIAILTDTLEYTINVISSFIGLYSLYLSSKPRDENHPYGHGKIEFISATIEGTLMIVSSLIIIYEAIDNLRHPRVLYKLDYGILLIAITGLVNYIVGAIALKKGKKNNSLALEATGKHMQSDTKATIGVLIGLVFIYFTHFSWIDSLISLCFAILIVVSGYKILRSSIAGIMDEADNELLHQIVVLCNENRRENWMDIHNLRIIKYGGTLHLDCHLTIPWYYNIHEGHVEVDALNALIQNHFGDRVELFVHTDGCLDFSCSICTKTDCVQRLNPMVQKEVWTIQNMSSNSKHGAPIKF